MQVQVHTNDKIQGGESLAQWVQQEVSTKLARFKESVTRVEVFFSDSDGASKSGAQDKKTTGSSLAFCPLGFVAQSPRPQPIFHVLCFR